MKHDIKIPISFFKVNEASYLLKGGSLSYGKTVSRYGEILSDDALKFIQEIHEEFKYKRLELLDKRKKRQKAIDGGEKLDFLKETREIRNREWKIKNIPDDLLKRQVANYFLGEIALKHNVPIVPYYEGVGVGGTLKAKYANRNEVFNLKIPEPTYYVDFLIRGFLKKEFKKDANVENLTWWIYGAGLNIRVYSSVKEYLNIETTKANYVKIPDYIKLSKTNDFANLIEFTIFPLSVEFAENINSDFKNKEDRKWLEKITKKTGTPEEFKLLSDLFIKIANSD